MSHAIELPDEVYDAIKRYAARQGETPEVAINRWVRELESAAVVNLPDRTLDWETATAEEIIADLRASRVEQG